MTQVIHDLSRILRDYGKQLNNLGEKEFSFRPAPGKWSRKEELGHLLDSAHNNLRRFVSGQFETDPHIVYDQDGWVKAFGYHEQTVQRLVSTWVLINEQILEVLRRLSPEATQRTCNTGKGRPSLHTIEWLAEDYVKHVLHHLHHILELEPIAY